MVIQLESTYQRATSRSTLAVPGYGPSQGVARRATRRGSGGDGQVAHPGAVVPPGDQHVQLGRWAKPA